MDFALRRDDLDIVFHEEDFAKDAVLWGVKYAKFLKRIRTKHLRANYATERKLRKRLLKIFRAIRQDVRDGMNMHHIHTKYDNDVLNAINSGIFQATTNGTAWCGDVLDTFIPYGEELVDKREILVEKYVADFWAVIDDLWSFYVIEGKVLKAREPDYEEIPVEDLYNPQKLDFRTRTRLVATAASWEAFNESTLIVCLLLPDVDMVLFWTADDERVCDECFSHHGNEYPASSPPVALPLHLRCRCIWIPVRRSWLG